MEDGKKALELYTHPGFFLLEWIEEQKKIREAAKAERKKRREERKAKKQLAEANSNKEKSGPKKPRQIKRVIYDRNHFFLLLKNAKSYIFFKLILVKKFIWHPN